MKKCSGLSWMALAFNVLRQNHSSFLYIRFNHMPLPSFWGGGGGGCVFPKLQKPFKLFFLRKILHTFNHIRPKLPYQCVVTRYKQKSKSSLAQQSRSLCIIEAKRRLRCDSGPFCSNLSSAINTLEVTKWEKCSASWSPDKNMWIIISSDCCKYYIKTMHVKRLVHPEIIYYLYKYNFPTSF